MPNTTWGIYYPSSTGHTRLWEHFQELAESVDATIIPPVYSARFLSSGVALDATTDLSVPFDTDDGTAGMTWNGTQWIIETAGRYQVSFSAEWSGVTGDYTLRVTQNDIQVRRHRGNTNADPQIISGSSTILCDPGDTVSVVVWQGDAGTLVGGTRATATTYADVTYIGRV